MVRRTAWNQPWPSLASIVGAGAGTVTERQYDTTMEMVVVLLICGMLDLVAGAWWPVNRGC